ncbi:MAG: glycosyltransferase [Caldilinea sp. CFX5]|nr:glycosyltransferase [Caldilinea sp. CFX5]
MSNITIIAYGTRGDVQPALALGKALQAGGHQVRLLAGANFGAWIKQHGVTPVPAVVDMQAIMAGPDGQEWVERGHNPLIQMRLMKRLIDRTGWPMMIDAWEASQGADLLISSFTSDSYALAIAEKLGIPQVTMPLQPALIATRDGRAIPNAPLPNRVSPLNYWFSKWVIEGAGWQLTGPLTNRLRTELLGLPPQSAAENLAARRRLVTLNAYSPHVVPQPADWPAHFHTTSYWFLAEESHWQPPPALLDFLAAGEPPVYIGFGSMTGRDPAGLTRLLVAAVQQSGRRVILLSGWAGMGQITLPPSIYCLDAAPHEWLFPRMAAVVHHGGAGTTAAGLQAGVPSILIPHFADQFFWGQRIAALGVGPQPIPRHKLTVDKLATALRIVTSDAAMQRRAADLGAAIRQEDGVGCALAVLTTAGLLRNVSAPSA